MTSSLRAQSLLAGLGASAVALLSILSAQNDADRSIDGAGADDDAGLHSEASQTSSASATRAPSAPPAQGADGQRGPWVDGALMLRVARGANPDAVARGLGGRAMPAGPSGYVRLVLPTGAQAEGVLRRAREHSGVEGAHPIARTEGVGRGRGKPIKESGDATTLETATLDDGATDGTPTDGTTSDGGSTESPSPWADVQTQPCDMRTGGRLQQSNPYQWHLAAIGAFPPDRIDFRDVTIAVLDTGVAYEDYQDASGTYVQAPSLEHTPIVAPWDFVNGDAHPNDDHQHGTHIASVIASRGAVEGVAPGATLMPLKVLDADNRGDELHLIDAIYHAIDNGADIINLSLSFHPDYPGSPALREALSDAAGAGVVVVAAAGNNAIQGATWPAAHPDVIAVAANGWSGGDSWTVNNVPGYANRSPRVDILAPGGDLSTDVDGDGVPDGVIAETIHPDDPSSVGLWAISGSSQAAAIASAVAAYPIAAGHAAELVPFVMGDASWSDSGATEFGQGLGAGLLLADQAQWLSCASNTTHVDPDRVHVSVLPVISRVAADVVAPLAHVQVTDPTGDPLTNQEVHATLAGTTGGRLSCTTDATGQCQLVGPETPDVDAAGAPAPLSWSVTVDVVVDLQSLEPYRPNPVLWSSDALELLLAATEQDVGEGTLLALEWAEESDPTLGDLAEGYSILAGGTGLATSPMGLVFNRSALSSDATVSAETLDIDGTGLATSPMGLYPVTLLTFDGSGLATSPMGFTSLTFVAFSGTGLATSPMGFTWDAVLLGEGEAVDEPSLNLDGGRIDLQSGAVTGADATGTFTGWLVGSGGWTVPETGLDGATTLLGSSTVAAPAAATEGASLDGSGSTEL